MESWPPLWRLRHGVNAENRPGYITRQPAGGRLASGSPAHRGWHTPWGSQVESRVVAGVLVSIACTIIGVVWWLWGHLGQQMTGRQTLTIPFVNSQRTVSGSLTQPLAGAIVQSTPGASEQILTVKPTTAPLRVATPVVQIILPESVLLSSYRGLRQERSLNCEFRSASDLANYYGYTVQWETLFLNVGHDPNGNPNKGFVGRSLDDPTGLVYPNGYGVYAEPIAIGLQKLGVPAVAHYGCSKEWLRQLVAQGNPVVVWVTTDMRPSEAVYWDAADGTAVKGVAGEHTMTVIGYDPQYIWVFDPADGMQKQYTWEQFFTRVVLLG